MINIEVDVVVRDRRTGFPLQLTGELDPRLSRWLWLVKMFLAIPHYLVLIVLWIGFLATTMVAGIAILITGRYPRRLFDFNVGILRWNWRVGFYVYAALATDRYPPFTLGRSDYPAHLEIAYPERLSRPRVLIKWLLAVPHLIIVILIAAPILSWWWTDVDLTALGSSAGYSMLNLLVVLAGFFLLVTGRYPGGLFDLLVGINRWLYRVLSYVALMHDEYPPFRLDQGADEPDLDRARPVTVTSAVRDEQLS